MPRGQYIDWDELRDGVPLWMWARDEHANGKSWGCIERELGCGDGAARKAAARKEAVALLPDPPAELPAPPCDDEPTAFIGNQEPAVPVTEGDQRMAAQLSARQRESEYTAAMAAATDDEPRIALPADVVRAALVAYAWCSQKPRRWSKAHDSRAAVETAQRILDECGEAA